MMRKGIFERNDLDGILLGARTENSFLLRTRPHCTVFCVEDHSHAVDVKYLLVIALITAVGIWGGVVRQNTSERNLFVLGIQKR